MCAAASPSSTKCLLFTTIPAVCGSRRRGPSADVRWWPDAGASYSRPDVAAIGWRVTYAEPRWRSRDVVNCSYYRVGWQHGFLLDEVRDGEGTTGTIAQPRPGAGRGARWWGDRGGCRAPSRAGRGGRAHRGTPAPHRGRPRARRAGAAGRAPAGADLPPGARRCRRTRGVARRARGDRAAGRLPAAAALPPDRAADRARREGQRASTTRTSSSSTTRRSTSCRGSSTWRRCSRSWSGWRATTWSTATPPTLDLLALWLFLCAGARRRPLGRARLARTRRAGRALPADRAPERRSSACEREVSTPTRGVALVGSVGDRRDRARPRAPARARRARPHPPDHHRHRRRRAPATTLDTVRARQRHRPAGQPAAEHARRGRRLGRLRRHRRPRADGRAALRPEPLLAAAQAVFDLVGAAHRRCSPRRR